MSTSTSHHEASYEQHLRAAQQMPPSAESRTCAHHTIKLSIRSLFPDAVKKAYCADERAACSGL